MNLTTTGSKMEVTTSAAGSVAFVVSFSDQTTTAFTPGENHGTISSATTTDMVAAPASGTQRIVASATIVNTHASIANTITVKKDVSATEYPCFQATLQPGWGAMYNGREWAIVNAAGAKVTSPLFTTAALTGVKSLTTGTSFAVYMGKAPRALTSAQVRYRVTTLAATITWAEVALAKGAVNVGGNPTLTVVGYADIAGTITSIGQKTTVVNVSSGQAINEGDDLWVIVGNSATTVGVVRAVTMADDLQVGVQASLATRPSLQVGNTQAWTIEGATTLAPWVALVV